MHARRILSISVALAALLAPVAASAESLLEALSAAYSNNPTLNAARASTRATDESVPQALAGYRPQITANISGSASVLNPSGSVSGSRESRQAGVGITITQPIFRGFRTENSVQAAEASVRAARESLRNTEQNVLLDAVEAYMNVIRDDAIVNLRESNITFLNEQVRAARDRFQVGEGTRTDVAQAEAALAAASSALSLARANVQSSRGVYRQIIGRDPRNLQPGRVIDKLLPKSFEEALNRGRKDHPAIIASVHSADVAAYNVKVIEGELLPTISLQATAQRSWVGGDSSSVGGTSGEIVGQITIPIYEGGSVYSSVRQAKETYGQRMIEVDATRDQVQAAVVAAWGGLEASRAQVIAARSQVDANRLALEGVIDEQRVGQRTTLDVLNAQTDLVDAQVSQVQAERDSVVAGYTVLSTVGQLSSTKLGLKVAAYKPETHYKQVRDKWGGLRTPDGR